MAAHYIFFLLLECLSSWVSDLGFHTLECGAIFADLFSDAWELVAIYIFWRSSTFGHLALEDASLPGFCIRIIPTATSLFSIPKLNAKRNNVRALNQGQKKFQSLTIDIAGYHYLFFSLEGITLFLGHQKVVHYPHPNIIAAFWKTCSSRSLQN